MTRRKKSECDVDTSVHPGSEYTKEEVEFIKAIDDYKIRTHKQWLCFTEILRIAKSLGYRKVGNG